MKVPYSMNVDGNLTIRGTSATITSAGDATFLSVSATNISATNFYDTNMTGGYAVVSNANKSLGEALTTTTQINYLSGVTSDVQAQINSKLTESTGATKFLPLSGGVMSGNLATNPNLLGLATLSAGFNMSPTFIAGLPLDYGYHDWSAFAAPYLYETTSDKSTWTSAAVNTKLFDAYPSTSFSTVASATSTSGVRWTWNTVQWTQIDTIIITPAYCVPPTCIFLMEVAVSGTTDWSIASSASFSPSNTTPVYLRFPEVGGNPYLRFSIIANGAGNSYDITSLQLWTMRNGTQGKSKTNPIPFSWDYNKNITFTGNLTGVNATFSGSITASYLYGKAMYLQATQNSVAAADYNLPYFGTPSTGDVFYSSANGPTINPSTGEFKSKIFTESGTQLINKYLTLSGGTMTGSITSNSNYPLKFTYSGTSNYYLASDTNGIYLAVFGSANSGKKIFLESYDTDIYHRKNGTNYSILDQSNFTALIGATNYLPISGGNLTGPLGMPGAVTTSATSLLSQGINFSLYHGITQFNGTYAAQITGGVGAIDGMFIYGYSGVALGWTAGNGTSAGVLSAALKTNGANVNIAGLLTVPTITTTSITATTISEAGNSLISKYLTISAANTSFSGKLDRIPTSVVSGDANTLTTNGIYAGYSISNAPEAGWLVIRVYRMPADAGDQIWQVAYSSYGSNSSYHRYSADYGVTWSSWNHNATLANLANYLPINNPTFTGVLSGPSISAVGSIKTHLPGSNTVGAGPYIGTFWDSVTFRGGFFQLNASSGLSLYVGNVGATGWANTVTFNNDASVSFGGTIWAANGSFSGNLSAANFYDTGFAGSKVLVSNTDKSIGESAISTTQLGYLSSVTSDIQTQLNNRMMTDGSNASSSVKIAAAVESNAISTVQYAGGAITANAPQAGAALRSAIKFDWYATDWEIGNIRGGSTDSAGFGIALSAGTNLRWRVTNGTTYDYNNLIVTGTVSTTAALSAGTLYEGGTSLAAKYLGINAAASSSNFLNKNTTFKYSGEAGIQYYDADMTPLGTSAGANTWQGPTSAWYQVIHMPLSVGNYFTELLFPVNDTAGLWWRQRRNASYYGWFKILDSQNFNTYALPLTGGTLTGPVSGTSISAANFYGTFNGSIGSAPYLPLSGGTMTGNISAGNITLYFGNATLFRSEDSNWIHVGGSGFLPATHNVQSLGSTTFQFSSIWGTTLYEGGTALSSKYSLASHSHTSINVSNANETVISNGYNDASGALYVNYRGTTSAINEYRFCNGLTTGALSNITVKGVTVSGSGISLYPSGGAVTFANGTWNTVGDDIQFGDINEGGVLGLRKSSGDTTCYIRFGATGPSAGGTKVGWDGSTFQIGSQTNVAGTLSATNILEGGTALSTKYSLAGHSHDFSLITGRTKDVTNISARTDSGWYNHQPTTIANGWPADSSWWHMMSSTHENGANYFALQIAADFYTQDFRIRSTNGNGLTSWSKIWTSTDFTTTNITNWNNASSMYTTTDLRTGFNNTNISSQWGYKKLGTLTCSDGYYSHSGKLKVYDRYTAQGAGEWSYVMNVYNGSSSWSTDLSIWCTAASGGVAEANVFYVQTSTTNNAQQYEIWYRYWGSQRQIDYSFMDVTGALVIEPSSTFITTAPTQTFVTPGKSSVYYPYTGGTIAGDVQILAGSNGWGEGIRVVRGLDTWAGFRLTTVNDSTSRNGNWALGYCADSTGNFVFAGHTGTVQNNVMRIKQAGGVDILGELTSSGLKLGYYSNTTYSGIWSTNVTKSDNNWSFLCDNTGAHTYLNASSDIYFQIFNGTRTNRMHISNTAINCFANLIGSTSYNIGATANWWGSGYFAALFDNNYRVWSQQSHPTTLAGYYISDAVNTTNGVVGVTLANSTSFASSFTQDIFGTTAQGYFLREVRSAASAPASLLGNFASGLAWKGADTFGSLSVSYDAANIRFSGGNGTTPIWTVDVWHSGNLNPQPLIPASNSSNFYRGDKTWSNALTTNFYSVGSSNPGIQFFNGGGYTEWAIRQLSGGDDSCVISSFASGVYTGDWIRLDKRNGKITLNAPTLVNANLSASDGYFRSLFLQSSVGCDLGLVFVGYDVKLGAADAGTLMVWKPTSNSYGRLQLGNNTNNYIGSNDASTVVLNSTAYVTIGTNGSGIIALNNTSTINLTASSIVQVSTSTFSVTAGGYVNMNSTGSINLTAGGGYFNVNAASSVFTGALTASTGLYSPTVTATTITNTTLNTGNITMTDKMYSAQVLIGHVLNNPGNMYIGIGSNQGFTPSTRNALHIGVVPDTNPTAWSIASSAITTTTNYMTLSIAGGLKVATLTLTTNMTATDTMQGSYVCLGGSYTLNLPVTGIPQNMWFIVRGGGYITSPSTFYIRGSSIGGGTTVAFPGSCCIATFDGSVWIVG